jgi:hypothetical protein
MSMDAPVTDKHSTSRWSGVPRGASTRARRAKGVRSGAILLQATALAFATVGCGHMGSAEDANASASALAFDRSLNTPAEACQLLAPGTRSELQDTFGPCERSLPQQHLPVASQVVDVDVYGKDAIVRLDRDVVFLARFDDGWKVTAAGCTPVRGRPFNCTIKGE